MEGRLEEKTNFSRGWEMTSIPGGDRTSESAAAKEQALGMEPAGMDQSRTVLY